ncbi:MAG: hydrogenase subunit MbhD domain-containing protein [Lachnospiraceae bacterium]|nr:hydrogenase subunit MbhD domain-containing protein [Lachnospiraceae bacterium]
MSGILFTILNTLVIIGAIASAITAVHAEKLISSVLALAATGSFVGLEFILLQAPDVAIAEVSVGAILSTILYIVALRKCREVDRKLEADLEATAASGVSHGTAVAGTAHGKTVSGAAHGTTVPGPVHGTAVSGAAHDTVETAEAAQKAAWSGTSGETSGKGEDSHE